MNIANLQATLRQFAAEREWQPFHTPKNLATALMVEAAELAEIFQWMTPEESREAQRDAPLKQHIGEEIADVFLYLLQMADHNHVDIEQAVKDKLILNAQKYPAKWEVVVVEPAESPLQDTHVLLDYENVQPTETELRAMVPEATRVWVFHGPHQKQVEQRFASFGTGMTTVPISKTGKNALDFHLSFYMGYIASRDQRAKFVVVANDKGYEPMLKHAKALGFAVRQHGHPRSVEPVHKVVATAAPRPATLAPKKAAAKKAPAKKAPTKKAVPKPTAKTPVAKKIAAKKTLPKKAAVKKPKPPETKSAPKSSPPAKLANSVPVAANAYPGNASAGSSVMLQKMADSLRKMGDKRPAKKASLCGALKSWLGTAASDESIGVALRNLIALSVVAIGSSGVVTYPKFGKPVEAGPAKG